MCVTFVTHGQGRALSIITSRINFQQSKSTKTCMNADHNEVTSSRYPRVSSSLTQNNQFLKEKKTKKKHNAMQCVVSTLMKTVSNPTWKSTFATQIVVPQNTLQQSTSHYCLSSNTKALSSIYQNSIEDVSHNGIILM